MATSVRRGLVAVVAVAVLGGAALVGARLASDDDEAPTTEVAAYGEQKPAGESTSAEPERWTGPQGRTGQFVAKCTYSHSGPNDPIVHAGMAGRSHLHDFYGAEGTDEASTPDELLTQPTTCDKPADSAAYWQPALYDGDELVEPLDLHAYYRAAPGVEPTDVEPFPFGLAIIAGDQYATEPQPGEATGWTCGSRTDLHDDPPTCPASAPLHLVLTFADCWDGEWLDSADHASHMAYSSGGACPDTHPVHVPQLTASIRFPIYGEGHDLRLASGNIYSAHGDFLNAWDPDGLEREIVACIHRGAVCDLASNREEEALFVGGG
ncbi:MAG: DUF1996 domain-containing protein [Acidimicrobiales bacterium]|nr:DUF1996 domain-containing protein [Acidimicrobiales bacterium]